MSDLAASITDKVAGDDLEIRRTVTGLPAAITDAWLTAKYYAAAPDADAVVQKAVDTTDAPGTGQVEAAGGVGVDGELRFDLVPVDTLKLAKACVYDIKIKTSAGKVYRIEKGTIELVEGVTDAS